MTSNDIINALQTELSGMFPAVTVFYTDFMPEEFERPSMFIKCTGAGPTERIASGYIKNKFSVTIGYFGETDDYYNTDKSGTNDVTDAIQRHYAIMPLSLTR